MSELASGVGQLLGIGSPTDDSGSLPTAPTTGPSNPDIGTSDIDPSSTRDTPFIQNQFRDLKETFQGERAPGGQEALDALLLQQEDERNRESFNDDIFNLAESLKGNLAGQPELNLNDIGFRGEDPRQKRLESLLNIFTNRSKEVQQRFNEPGSSQTRLSLLE